MNVGALSVIALLGIIVIGCAGGEIAPADSAATAPEDGDPIAALYAAPAEVAYVTVSDFSADIVGPADGPPAAAFFGYSYEAELVTPFVDNLDGYPLPPPSLTGPKAVASPALDAGPDIVPLLALAASDAVAPPVDIDAFFTAAASADDASARAPETQQPPPVGWEAPPLDAK